MKDKGICYLYYDEKKRPLNYVIKDGDLMVITSKNSQKVDYMKTHDDAKIECAEGRLCLAKPKFIDDPDQVHALFDYMTEHDSNHFKSLRDDLIAIKFNF